ncbi:hypothetical protein JYG33_08205 [Alcaligenes sp. SORT26]|uniref:hypothetical protein n=1 Tax=Alcaligenes sp. SORT26 TaxID=2813780 RepID=UPI001A9E79DC|nr:hypothetical protein [Alcaligenes sp. SORT26]QTC01406.1 hypothetical protein JYG33_08205 [Alcaligenes sp. SORT26]
MTTKTRFTSSRIVLLSLTASLFSATAQSDSLSTTYFTPPPGATLQNLDRTINHVFPQRPSHLQLDQPELIDTLEQLKNYEARIRDAIDISYVTSSTGKEVSLYAGDSIDVLGRLIEQPDLPLDLNEVSGTLVRGIGNTVRSVGGVLYDDPNNRSPLTSALDYATGGLADATDILFQNNGQLQLLQGSPGSSLLTGNESSTSLLAPVTTLVNGLNGNMSTDSAANNGLLAPVNQLIAGLTGAVPTAGSGNTGVLQPVTGLVNGLLGGPPR